MFENNKNHTSRQFLFLLLNYVVTYDDKRVITVWLLIHKTLEFRISIHSAIPGKLQQLQGGLRAKIKSTEIEWKTFIFEVNTLCNNKRLSKQLRLRWFGTTYRSLWRHCNEGPSLLQKWCITVKKMTAGMSICSALLRCIHTIYL